MVRTPAARVVVFGAGAFGGWTALELVRRGARVTLVDAWGPGHVRSSSGGQTRVVRATYGTHEIHTRLAARALALWRDHDERTGRSLMRITGALWMFCGQDHFGRACAETMRANGLSIEELTPAEAGRRYPQIAFGGVTSVLFEPEAGFVFARRSCALVAERVVLEGGQYLQAAVRAPVLASRALPDGIPLSDGSSLQADAFVFACGPWLGALFPEVVGPLITPTRQEVFYFGTPAGDPRFEESGLPVWLDFGERIVYGIPGNAHRGFKFADDTPGPLMDPTEEERVVTREGTELARAFVGRRFPALAGAPLVASEVCQYETTPDAEFIIDRHPEAANVWILGGGSGHGFKMGPVIGERVASLVLGDTALDPAFGLARFARPPDEGWRPKWS